MLIGIISDTHDDMRAVAKAVELFNSKAVARVIHAGDMVSPFTFEIFSGLRCPFTGIFGNNDGDRLLLMEKSGGRIFSQPYVFEQNGRRFAVLHESDIVDALADSGRFDVVIYGHTHTPDIRRLKGALIINPGKAATLHKGTSTVALLDMNTMEAEIIPL